MLEAHAPERETSIDVIKQVNYLGPLVVLLFFICVLIPLFRLSPPPAVSSGAPETEFSSERALKHARAVAAKPRPMDAPGHAEAREYILSELARIGVETQVQTAMVVDQPGRSYIPAATVRNIVARIPGVENSKAILLVGHYDTVPSSTGAGDNASAVAAMLETARALKASPPLKNDVTFLFTDCEEVSLMGAKAYMSEFPGAKDAGLVLNFEALGNGGASLMFETGNENRWVIREFAKASRRPIATSLSNDIYKVLPYLSDFQVFKDAGAPGLNFAFLNNAIAHHTNFDSLPYLDERSVQHHGEYALSLTRHFGNLNLNENGGGSSVYFDVLGLWLVHYPATWAILFAGLAGLLFIAVTVYGFRKGLLKARGILMGVIELSLSAALAAIVSSLLWRVITLAHVEYRMFPGGYTYNDQLYLVGLIALTITITSALMISFRKKNRTESLTVGAALCWLILSVITSLVLPGVSYLFTWPLIFGLLGLGMLFSTGENMPLRKLVAVVVICAPTLFLFTPLIVLLVAGVSLNWVSGVIFLVVLVLGLLALPLSLVSPRRNWLLPVVSALAFVVIIIAGSATRGFSKERPKPNNVFYALNADSGKAVWASYDQVKDQYTSQFFPPDSERGSLLDILPGGFNRYMKHEAPPIAVAGPNVELLNDVTKDENRVMKFRITSPRQAPVMSVFVNSPSEIVKILVNGKPNTGPLDRRFGLHYFAFPKEGIEVTVEAKAALAGPPASQETSSAGGFKMRLADLSYGLPDIQGVSFNPRPDHMMAAAAPHSDVTVVTRSFSF